MTKVVLNKLDRLINQLTLALIVGGGLIIHLLTALTIRSYHGDLLGYISFALPGIAELYLILVQLGDNMYNYTIIVALFAIIALTMTLIVLCKNFIRVKVEMRLEKRAVHSP